QGDMEQLTRDFNDPELDTFVDQAIFDALADGPRPLPEVVAAVLAAVPTDLRGRREWQRNQVEDRVLARFVRGRYRGRLGPPTLAAQGLIDLYWEPVPSAESVRTLLAQLLANNRQYVESLQREFGWTAADFDRTLSTAEGGGWVARTGRIVRIS